MMLSSFTEFDYTTYALHLPMHLLSLFMIISSHFQMYWIVLPSRLTILWVMTKAVITLVRPTKMANMLGTSSIMLTVFSMLLFTNVAGLLPYLPSITSHLVNTLSLGLPIWFSMIIWSLTINLTSSTGHYLPEDTLPIIAPFLATVEGISSIIRPITLSFRLSANISAGHVIMSMISAIVINAILSLFTIIMLLLLTIGSSYMVFETMVCLVQAFVFALLGMMYSNDYLTS